MPSIGWTGCARCSNKRAPRRRPRISNARSLAINEPAFEDDAVSHPGRQLAADLGLRIGQFSNVAPELAEGPPKVRCLVFFPI